MVPSAFSLGSGMKKCLPISLWVKPHTKTQSKHMSEQGILRELLRCSSFPFMLRSPHFACEQHVMSNWLANPIGKLAPEVGGACGMAGAILQPLKLWTHSRCLRGNHQACVGWSRGSLLGSSQRPCQALPDAQHPADLRKWFFSPAQATGTWMDCWPPTVLFKWNVGCAR